MFTTSSSRCLGAQNDASIMQPCQPWREAFAKVTNFDPSRGFLADVEGLAAGRMPSCHAPNASVQLGKEMMLRRTIVVLK